MGRQETERGREGKEKGVGKQRREEEKEKKSNQKKDSNGIKREKINKLMHNCEKKYREVQLEI